MPCCGLYCALACAVRIAKLVSEGTQPFHHRLTAAQHLPKDSLSVLTGSQVPCLRCEPVEFRQVRRFPVRYVALVENMLTHALKKSTHHRYRALWVRLLPLQCLVPCSQHMLAIELRDGRRNCRIGGTGPGPFDSLQERPELIPQERTAALRNSETCVS